ncbi:MAG: tellurite resistance TerB family protein [Minwuia sp.]|uniref:tellurite resistance TerB family protein n=1 Tax=Minwuia sp. TaxID=2493630 RepID=UPI003A886EDD
MNPQNLLEQFLGADAGAKAGQAMQGARDRVAGSGWAGVAGGVAAGGLIGVLLGSKKARKTVGKVAGGVVGYGGAAALGALAYRAYQNWQSGKAAAPAPASAPPPSGVPAAGGEPELPPEGSKFLPATAPAGDGRPFELALILAMVAAANADGHIGADEQRLIFERAGEMSLDAEDKAFVFDALSDPPGLKQIAALPQGPEQAAEIYLASRLAIDPDEFAEKAYLEALASRLSLPPDLVAHLESQVRAAAAA